MAEEKKQTMSVQNQWKAVKNRRQLWLFPMLVIGFLVVSFIFVFIPQVRAIIEGREELRLEQENLDKLIEKRVFLSGLSDVELTSQLILLNNALPSEKPVFSVLGSLVGQVEEAELELEGYDLSPGLLATASSESEELYEEVEVGKLTGLPVEFSITGPFESINKLLISMENTVPISRVRNISISGFEERGEEGGLNATLTMVVYYSLPPTDIGKISDPLIPLTVEDEETIKLLASFDEFEFEVIDIPEGYDELREDLFSF